MTQKVEVKMIDEIDHRLGLKTSAKKLFNKLNKNAEEVILDFTGIEYMSRSFTQEYVFQKRNFKGHITEINMSDMVENMYNVVNDNFCKSKIPL